MITAEHYTARMGGPPVQDDLERCNCPQAGELGHYQCGWDAEYDLPIFLVGRTPSQRASFERSIAALYPRKEPQE